MKHINNDISYEIQKKISLSFDKFTVDKSISKDIKSPSVNYKQLIEQLNRTIQLTKRGIGFGDTYQSLFIWSPTGLGKTEIVKQVAEENGAVYHKLEIQKVPIEELQGFPYLHKTSDGKTVVRLAHPTDLPPSDDDRLWVFHLDEFNKADTDDMAAVMNLVLNGEIGGSADYNETTGKSEKYKLPKRTVIIGSGNPKEQAGSTSLNSVNNFDTATAERWHRNLYLKYDALSWLSSYALKPFKWNGIDLSTRIPEIIVYYILDKYLESQNLEEPFLVPKRIVSDDNESEITMSPRSWTLASNEIICDCFLSWENETEESKLKYNNNFDEYLKDPNVQIKSLNNNVYEFGLNGSDTVRDIIARFVYFSENRILPEDIVFKYINNRDKVKRISSRKGSIIYLLYGIGKYIREVEKWDDVKIPALNISTFITDAEIPPEDLSVFVYELTQINSKPSKELSDILFSINKNYKESYKGFFYTGEEILKEVN